MRLESHCFHYLRLHQRTLQLYSVYPMQFHIIYHRARPLEVRTTRKKLFYLPMIGIHLTPLGSLVTFLPQQCLQLTFLPRFWCEPPRSEVRSWFPSSPCGYVPSPFKSMVSIVNNHLESKALPCGMYRCFPLGVIRITAYLAITLGC